ncbi:peptide-methionine (S)-S-oxide reductase MsrA [Sagittula stellata]|uniref:Peptide methionine sulfoxide reductase MsrA n=1 Tax=Sagittula stellata (strain ATCC 700073 / DSM 11524 / E-37) TaxID=388399 RepID=A3K2W4_SAGS3|nr:peptide-methionine (S)-S-oxide reductase MsrA [Sagittula stellata]EBA08523.1 methionine-S-sulfoxide reductase [Sagittula stellata E-37]
MNTIRILTTVAALIAGLAVQGQRAEAAELFVAGGCFWCVEADFEKVRGVDEVVSGYTGGSTKNPTYKQVSRGGTGHYEAVRINYDEGEVTARQLYDLFFRSVDPTDAGGQFCDRGESYRTAIFVTNAAQKQAAEAAKAEAEKALGKKIVTPILSAGPFYKAEDYHQNYYKGDSRTLTRFGPIKQKDAYKRYRDACGRDQRVKQLWGDAAPFVN